MDKDKVISYFEGSFLSKLLIGDDVTDISYNGQDIYYVSNKKGRIKSDIILSQNNARDFLRQLSNVLEKQFSYSSPILDSSFGRYRINALHQSIGRVNDEEAVTFSIRIASKKPRITSGSDFMNKELESLFDVLIRSKKSILIGGTTGSGKTEFQKYLIRKMPSKDRVIVIDNVLELEQQRSFISADLTFWASDERNIYTKEESLIKNALRNNPDWLIIAESRGKEMYDVLNGVLTGMPIISTLHSQDAPSIIDRVASMVMMNDKTSSKNEIKERLVSHIHYYVYLTKKMDEKGNIKREISEIIEANKLGVIKYIYKKEKTKTFYGQLDKELLKTLEVNVKDELFIKTFVKGEL